MQDDRWIDEEETDLDESDLAGLSQYSATGGGGWPLHSPVLRPAADEPEVPDATSFRELYRYSLGRSTQDAQSEAAVDDWNEGEGGPLHVLARTGGKAEKKKKKR